MIARTDSRFVNSTDFNWGDAHKFVRQAYFIPRFSGDDFLRQLAEKTEDV